jgi:chromosome segregation ATPase
MEIARLTAICRKSDCGPLENELVHLRAQIATLEKRNADLEEGRDNFESQYALMEKQLARKDAKLEAEEKENTDLDSKNAELDSKNDDLEIEILEIKSKLASPPPCEDRVVHEENYKWLSGRYYEELDETLQQAKQVTELEEENEKLKDDMAMMATGGVLWRASVVI